MPRALRLTLLWLGTTVLAVTVSWFGVRLVLYAAVPDQSEPPSAAELESASPRDTDGPAPAAGATQSPAPTPVPLNSAESPQNSADGDAGQDAESESVSRQKWTDDQGRVNHLSIVTTTGGWTKIQWNSSAVTVLDTYAKTGYTARLKQNSATQVRVWFESSGRSITVTAWWDDGAPRLEVSNGN